MDGCKFVYWIRCDCKFARGNDLSNEIDPVSGKHTVTVETISCFQSRCSISTLHVLAIDKCHDSVYLLDPDLSGTADARTFVEIRDPPTIILARRRENKYF